MLDDLLADDFMRFQHDPPLERGPGFDRVEEEDENVMVPDAIAAIKREPDNDYRVILVSVGTGQKRFMNIEVSGLPLSWCTSFLVPIHPHYSVIAAITGDVAEVGVQLPVEEGVGSELKLGTIYRERYRVCP